ncbi:hypothetical protein ES288_D06G177600v1 [Gossypium darwinii]|uniref:HAT C-terminal dimerisation domain-containing protein n=1 Tax=Gossypium darwinii TaxID=34276 RepID=A0A5D2CB22_GOSDA|nr:hypothetical protein ES288_D06G177600v1 [Gossypium darwinii]
MKSKTIESFFKRKSTKTTQSPSEASQIEVPPSSFVLLNSDARPSKISRVEDEALDLPNLEREPGLRKQIYEYPINMRDEIRIAYIKAGPYQHILSEYLASNSKQHSHLDSLHNNTQRAYVDLMNQAQHVKVSLDRQTTQQILANRLHLKTSHDESSGSKNRGNFLELLSLLALYDEKVEDVLKIAPQNAKIGDRKFSIIKMAIILRFVDKQGQNVIFNVLLQHSFDIQNIQGQGYDGASNMRGEFNGLQALILNDYRYAFYVHCFAHQMVEVHQLFKDLYDIVNIASASSKQHNELQKAQAVEITHLIDTLQRPGETRWSFHFNSITSLLKMYNATSTVLENLKNTTSNYSQRGDAHNTYNRLRSFEFIFILHMMKEVLGVTDNLCQALQCHSQDTLNDMSLLKNVISFSETWEMDFPDMHAQYIMGRSRNKKANVTVEHHYRSRFNENVVKLLTLTIALDPNEFFKLFDIDKICILVNKFYPEYFSQQERERLPYELKHYELDVCNHPDLRKISTLSKLSRSLVDSGKSTMYPLVDRLIRLILTLSVSTTSSKRSFSAMKIVKTQLRSKMEDDFLRSSLVVYIEKEIAEKFNINKIIDDFSEVKDRRVQFK